MNLEEKTLESKEIFKGKIIHVRHDRVALPNGHESYREVVDHPGGVMVAPLLPDGKLLFVRQFRYPYGEVVLELPAGKLEPGEAPEQAGIRELEEEAGAVAGKMVPLGKLYPSPGYCGEIIYMYLAPVTSIGEQHPDADEFLEKTEIPLEQAVEMVMDGTIKDAKTIAGVLKINQMKLKGELGNDLFG